MDWLITAVGGALVVVALRDVFHTLFHPGGDGSLSSGLSAIVWAVLRRLGPHARGMAGGVAVVGSLVMWAGMLVAGFALVYLPRLPDGFSYGSTLEPSTRGGLVDALYTSAVVLATLGLGDIVPVEPWLRLLVPVEALIGFALLTAGVSWLQQIQPALARRRTLARHLTVLRGAQTDVGTSLPTAAELAGIATGLARVHVDLRQASPTFYFVEREDPEALPRVLPYARELARTASAHDDDDDLRRSGAALDRTVTGLARFLGTRFLGMPDDAGTDEVLRRFATVHGHPVEVPPTTRD
jgi:hypothetical protein